MGAGNHVLLGGVKGHRGESPDNGETEAQEEAEVGADDLAWSKTGGPQADQRKPDFHF